MADRPIIFSAPMVRAMIEGRKTQTRRTLGTGNTLFDGGPWTALHKRQVWDWEGAWVDDGPSPAGNPGPYLKLPWKGGDDDRFEDGMVHRIYPVIQPGDRLFVKEAVTWVSAWGWRYRADNDDLSEKREQGEVGRWRSPIFMPRMASRLTLTVTDVRVQRLAELTDADAIAEGINVTDDCAPSVTYAKLWDDLNAKRGFSWQSNPWVVALTFRTESNSARSNQ